MIQKFRLGRDYGKAAVLFLAILIFNFSLGVFLVPAAEAWTVTYNVNISGPGGTLSTGSTGVGDTGLISVNQTVVSGDAAMVLAVADPGFHFVNWTGDAGFAARTSNPLIVRNVTADMNITANFAANTPGTITLPDYSKPLLGPASQTNKWTNVVPNALSSIFTYTPYTNAAAQAAGFPAGVCGVTEDCYTISARNFTQQLSIPLLGGTGLIDPATGNPFGAVTKVYGYGSSTNAPSVGPFTAGVWHFPAPTIRGTKGRPIRIQWLNELTPTEPPSGFDPTVDCGANAPFCYPYNRIVTHVHGAHVTDDSDGYAGAWFTPGFAQTGPGWVSTDMTSIYQYGPQGTYRYPMDQEASTIWYHDHAMGVTHNNTQMGLAGFFPITDANEQALIAANILPTGDYELGFALQDRMFDTEGQFAMPDYPVYDMMIPGPGGATCGLTADGLADPFTCTRLDWMLSSDGTHLIPYDVLSITNTGPGQFNEFAPFPAASTSLEYFGNMPVVNGVTYGTYDLEPRVYRMRFIGGTDSRTWILSLEDRANPGVPIPFWQIGSEQGLLNNPVSRTTMDLLPGERLDVLVNLAGLGGKTLVLKNLGPDTPYGGPLAGDPASVDIPEIMEFHVGSTITGGTDNIIAPSGATNLRPATGPVQSLTVTPGTAATRYVALEEGVDEYGRVMPTIDGRGFMPGILPITEVVRLNDVEEWAIINNTADAHPIHLHLVQFQLINRQACDFNSYVAADMVSPWNQAFCAGTGPVFAADPWEAGWKDTIDAPPGMITRVRAKFDLPGSKFVYHCHILSHEEHDMMRPLSVVTAPMTLLFTSGANGSILGGTPNLTQTVNFGADAAPVTAVPDTGYHFVNWTGPNGFVPVTANPLTLTNVTASQELVANFALNQYTIVANAAGNGSGTVASDVGGISYTYPAANTMTSTLINHGTDVTLTATAATGSTVSWTACSGVAAGNGSTSATCTYSPLTGDVTSGQAVATFTLNQYTIVANAAGNGSGTVASSAGGISYSYPTTNTMTSALINHGTTVTLTATAATGSTVLWTSCSGVAAGNGSTSATCTYAPLTGNVTSGQAVATFTLNQYTVTVDAGGSGSGSVISNTGGISLAMPPGGQALSTPLDHGTNVVLTATADPGTSVSWSSCSGVVAGNGSASATCTYSSLDGNKSAVATFTTAGFAWYLLPGMLVSFTDTSTGTPAAWSWTFGDGNTSNLQNPEHTYAVTGSYNVSLTTDLASVTKTVFASVCVQNVAHVVSPSSYNTFMNAYNTAAAAGGTVQLQATTVADAPVLAGALMVDLRGGYDCDYTANNWYSTITTTSGPLTVSGGGVIVDRLIIQ